MLSNFQLIFLHVYDGQLMGPKSIQDRMFLPVALLLVPLCLVKHRIQPNTARFHLSLLLGKRITKKKEYKYKICVLIPPWNCTWGEGASGTGPPVSFGRRRRRRVQHCSPNRFFSRLRLPPPTAPSGYRLPLRSFHYCDPSKGLVTKRFEIPD